MSGAALGLRVWQNRQPARAAGGQRRKSLARTGYDGWFVSAVAILLALGVVMVGSASMDIADKQLGQPFYYLLRQLAYLGIGLLLTVVIVRVELRHWQRSGGLLMIAALLSLLLVLVPGVGHEVNGSIRWLSLGLINVQPSELVKLFVIIYLSGYLVRRSDEVRESVLGFAKPMALLAILCLLLLLEPDFGAVAIMMTTAVALMFLAGVRLWQFFVLFILVGLALAALAYSSPYRVARMTAFMDPWADPFASGFQLTQALIAFGRGEWLGVGLGSSIQKLFYLPEAHTDFMFAVLAEELGLIAVAVVILSFVVLVVRTFKIGRRAERAGQPFGAYLAYGLGLWIALQAFTNIGVNLGVLPTKGLTLPLMSYGGSSLIVMLVAVALIIRVDYEARQALNASQAGRRQPSRRRPAKGSRWRLW
jgi:cell division protein FtsW